MLDTGLAHDGPAAVRYPRGTGPGLAPQREPRPLTIGEAELRRHGKRLALVAVGAMVPLVAPLADELDATLVNLRFVKPLDAALLAELARSHSHLVTIEDGCVAGGAGSAVAECLQAQGLAPRILQLGLPDRFLPHGSREEVLALAGLDLPGVRRRVLEFCGPRAASAAM
jgi:1-deoxy-D-xylulose-5-phosphate synthase